MDTYAKAAAALQELAKRTWEPPIVPLGSEPAQDVVAIDGSNAVLLDRGAVWVVATTAHAWRPKQPALADPEIHVATREEAESLVEAQFAGLGCPPPRINSAESFAVAMRESAELRLAMEAAKTNPDLLLVDGALLDVPAHAQPACDVLLAAGAVGVSKRSSLTQDGVPLQYAAQQAGRNQPAPWVIPRVKDSVWAKLHAGAKHVYRVDGHNPERLVPWSADAMYLGYPYPLAAAHNAVVLSADRLAEQRLRLETAVRKVGVEALALLQDPHALLDRNV